IWKELNCGSVTIRPCHHGHRMPHLRGYYAIRYANPARDTTYAAVSRLRSNTILTPLCSLTRAIIVVSLLPGGDNAGVFLVSFDRPSRPLTGRPSPEFQPAHSQPLATPFPHHL